MYRTLHRVCSSTSAALFKRGWCHRHFCDLGRGGSRGDFGTEGGAEVGRSGRATAVDSGSADGAVSCGAAAPADLAFCVRGGAFPPNRNAVSLRSGSAWQVPRPVSSEVSAMGSRPVRIEADDEAGWRVQNWTAKRLRQTLPSGVKGSSVSPKKNAPTAFKIGAAGACFASAMGKVRPYRIEPASAKFDPLGSVHVRFGHRSSDGLSRRGTAIWHLAYTRFLH